MKKLFLTNNLHIRPFWPCHIFRGFTISSILFNNPFFAVKFILIILFLAFVSKELDWSMTHFFILVLLTLGAILSLLLLHNRFNREYYYNGDMIAIFTGYYLSLLEKTITNSPFNDTFLSINITIGLSMVIIGIFNPQKTISIKNKLLFILHNKKLIFIFVLAMTFIVFTVNVFFFLLGLGITVDTSSFTLFLYTFFPKIILIKCILIFIFFCITKELKIDNVSLSLFNVIFMILFGVVNYYYIIPIIKVIMFLGSTKLNNIFTDICLIFKYSSIKTNGTQSLVEGIYNIFTKFPIIGRLLELFKMNKNHCNYIHNPFRLIYDGIIRNKININTLTKLSKFTTVYIATIENKIEFSYSYKGNIDHLKVLLNNNIIDIKSFISNLVSNYGNLTCKIHLKCSDEIVNLNTTFKNGQLEELNINRTSLNLAKKVYKQPVIDTCSKYKNSFYDLSENRVEKLLHLTDPSKNGYSLQVFPQQNIVPYDFSIKHGESSINTGESFNFNRGTKRGLESENNDIDQRTNSSEHEIPELKSYPCIVAGMMMIGENSDLLSLQFDSTKLAAEGSKYLEEICIVGRSVLLEHYGNLTKDETEIRNKVDNFPLDNVVLIKDVRGQLEDLYKAFMVDHPEVTENPREICLFSKLYIDGNLDYSEDDRSDDSCAEDSTQQEQKDVKFEPQAIDSLIHELREKQNRLFANMNNISEGITSCTLNNIGFKFEGGVFSEDGRKNRSTYMLTILKKENPSYFIEGDLISDVENTRVSSLCFKLGILAPDLKEEDYLFLTIELKNRVLKLYNARELKGNASTACQFKDLGVDWRAKILVEEFTDQDNKFTYKTNEFTRLLGRFVYKNLGLCRMNNYLLLRTTKVEGIYDYLKNLIRKRPTKEEIRFIIDELKSRKANFLAHNVIRTDKVICLRDLNLRRIGWFYFFKGEDEDLAKYELARLLENLLVQEPSFFPQAAVAIKCIDTLILQLKPLA